jgi:hypothetical protein
MLVQIHLAAQPGATFVDYLLRLGCTVVEYGDGAFDVSVTYPETVHDETAALTEWCASWTAAHPSEPAVVALRPAA